MSRVWKQNFRARPLKPLRYELTFKHNVYMSQLKKNTVLENPKYWDYLGIILDFVVDVPKFNQERLVAILAFGLLRSCH